MPKALLAGLLIGLGIIALLLVYGRQEFLIVKPSSNQVESSYSLEQSASPSQEAIKQLQQELEQQSSARHTQADRPIMTNPNGELSLSPALLRYFDYYLTLRGEYSLAQLKGLLESDIQRHYPERFWAALLDLFDRYVAYKQGFAESLSQLSDDEIAALMHTHKAYQDLQHKLRLEHFSEAEIEALFIANEQNLAKKSQSQAFDEKYQQYQQNKSIANATELFGVEAAQRLENLAQKRKQWQALQADYRLQRDAILISGGLDDAAKAQAISQLQSRLFSANDTRRIQALERAGQL